MHRSYEELEMEAFETKSTEALQALADWFQRNGWMYWNGESYSLRDGYRLYPIYKEIEDDCYEIIGWDLR